VQKTVQALPTGSGALRCCEGKDNAAHYERSGRKAPTNSPRLSSAKASPVANEGCRHRRGSTIPTTSRRNRWEIGDSDLQLARDASVSSVSSSTHPSR